MATPAWSFPATPNPGGIGRVMTRSDPVSVTFAQVGKIRGTTGTDCGKELG
jgi:hypothetical protein